MSQKHIRYALIVLVIEKIIQHSVVTLAFLFDVGNIRTEVAVRYEVLMVSGFIVGILFALSLWGMLRDSPWAISLITALALFDFIGEFVAQGKLLLPTITVSFVVALVLLVLSLRYRQLA